MSTREAFLQAILETPEDDVPRLVFSDWLEDHGEVARAQLIRAQCKMATLPTWDREYQELAWRVEALLAEHRAAWIRELPRLSGIEWADFERGFVSTIRVDSVKALYEHDAEIAEAAPVFRVEFRELSDSRAQRPEGAVPWLRAVRLVSRCEVWVSDEQSVLQGIEELELVRMHEYADLRWLHTPALSQVRRIRLQGSHTAGQAVATRVLADPNLTLERLEIGTRFIDYNSGYFDDPTLGVEGTVELAAAAQLTNLKALNLNRQRLGAAGFRAVLSSASLEKVRELELRASQTNDFTPLEAARGTEIVRLDLSQTPMGEAGVRSLVKGKRFARLERLDLDTCEINAAALTALTKAPFWKSLRSLDLSHNPLGADGLEALSAAKAPALHALILSDCDMQEDSGPALGRVAWLKKLLTLDLSSNPLGSAGVQQLVGLVGGSIRRLILSETGLDAAAAATLAPLWPQLIHLDLAGNPLASEGLAALLAGGTAKELLTLNLRNTNLLARGLKAFLKKPDCPQLRSLTLSGNALTTATVKELLASPLLGTLRELHLVGCELGSTEALLFAEATELSGLSVLNLRDNELSEAGLLALATSKPLKVVELQLSGNPWSFKEAARKTLERRLGSDWYYYQEEEEDAEEEYDEYMEDDLEEDLDDDDDDDA